jgi:hypothetical protein
MVKGYAFHGWFHAWFDGAEIKNARRDGEIRRFETSRFLTPP